MDDPKLEIETHREDGVTITMAQWARTRTASEAALNEYVERWTQDERILDFWMYESQVGKWWVISNIKVKHQHQGTGVGTLFMDELCALANAHGKMLVVTPTPESRKKAALLRFYKRFGFVKNGGRHKDFRVSESYIRLPRTNDPSVKYRTTLPDRSTIGN